MKILSISSLFPYPDLSHHGIFVYNRLNAMAKMMGEDYELDVITPIPHSIFHKPFKKYAAQLSTPPFRKQGNVNIHAVRYFSMPGLLKGTESYFSKKAILPYLDKIPHIENVDIIDVHWGYPDLIVGVEVKKRIHKPLVLTLRGMETFYLNDPRQKLIAASLEHVDAIISLSQEMADYVKSIGFKGPISVIPNGTDVSRFCYTPMAQAREALGIPFAQKVILAVGSVIERKGFHLLIEALASMKDIAGATLYIVGKPGLEGDFLSRLNEQVEKHELEDRVIFVGSQDNDLLPLWYNAANVFCLSSYGEGSPNVLVEALSTGCPAIAHNVGDVRSAISHSVNSKLLSDPNYMSFDDAAKAWCSPLRSLLLSAHTSQSRREQSIRYSQFNWDWCARNVIDFISRIK